MKNAPALILLALVTASLTCRAPDRASPVGQRPLGVFVTLMPQAYFVERIGGEHVSVSVLVQPGQSPHTFELTPRQMTALSSSALFFTIGMPFEKTLVEKIRTELPHLTVAQADDGIEKRIMATHDHEHDSSAPDPHIWMSPPFLRTIAKNVANALRLADPDNAQDYAANLDAVLVEIDSTDVRIRQILEPYEGSSFYVFHPAFGYFGDAYGLKQVAIETEGKSPTPKQLNGLIGRAKAEKVRIIFVQPQFDRKAAQAVADAIGGAVIPIDPLEKDVLRNLIEMAAKLEIALTE